MPGFSNASNLKIVQTTGQDQNAVMSQDAVTGELALKQNVFTVGYGLNLNGTTLSLNGRDYKFVNTLPQSGVADTVYFTPNGLPADVANAVNAAYEHWGSLGNYPYLIFTDTRNANEYWLLLVSNTNPYVSGNHIYGNGFSVRGLKWNASTNTASNQFTSDYLAHDFTQISYVNFDLAGNQAHTTTYKEANISSDIDYSNGAEIANSYTGYVWNGSAFEIKDKIDVAIIINAIMGVVNSGLAKKLNANQGSANAGKFLKVANDGSVTYDTVSVPSVVQSTGSSQTDVMSQNAVTTAINTAIADVSALIGGASS